MLGSILYWFLLIILGLIGSIGGGSPAVASTSISHATHFVSDKGPRLPQDESGCLVCHAPGELQCQGQPLFADMNFLAVTNVCDPCHTPGGAYDGVNDAVIGAKSNWDTGIYESDGVSLKAGKEGWCASCHDTEPANSKPDGSGVNAPKVLGDNSPMGTISTATVQWFIRARRSNAWIVTMPAQPISTMTIVPLALLNVTKTAPNLVHVTKTGVGWQSRGMNVVPATGWQM